MSQTPDDWETPADGECAFLSAFVGYTWIVYAAFGIAASLDVARPVVGGYDAAVPLAVGLGILIGGDASKAKNMASLVRVLLRLAVSSGLSLCFASGVYTALLVMWVAYTVGGAAGAYIDNLRAAAKGRQVSAKELDTEHYIPVSVGLFCRADISFSSCSLLIGRAAC